MKAESSWTQLPVGLAWRESSSLKWLLLLLRSQKSKEVMEEGEGGEDEKGEEEGEVGERWVREGEG